MSSTVYVPGAASFDHVVFATWLVESTGGACIAAKQSKDKKFFSVEFKSGTPPTHGVVNNLLIPLYPSAEALPTLYNAKVEDLPFGSIPEVLLPTPRTAPSTGRPASGTARSISESGLPRDSRKSSNSEVRSTISPHPNLHQPASASPRKAATA